MRSMARVRVSRPIRAVGMSATCPLAPQESVADARARELEGSLKQAEAQRDRLEQVGRVLEEVTARLSQVHQQVLDAHRKQIARLAVEIARKVLVRKIADHDYQIEAIVEEALQIAPTLQGVVVHLNPADLADLQTVLHSENEGPLAAVRFVGDPAVSKAECVLETPKGVVESFVEGRLAKIEEALEKAGSA